MLVVYMVLERPLTERQIGETVRFLGDKDVSWRELENFLRTNFYRRTFSVDLYNREGAERAGKLAEALEVLVLFQGDGSEWLNKVFEKVKEEISLFSVQEIFKKRRGYELPLRVATRQWVSSCFPRLGYEPQHEIVFML